ncbi:TetR/AcrR family transcriptional regulator [Mucilaginibacter flavus]|uniref:TetR/AcrR family transcriptional regulator n=1 Tax=Mucilaginibacter flavus TaxID=931504 RepID=UPI0025B5140E|nr:TetR/AcrR family transcriptional regulator [Mucilaginibacter flavus]MDN3580719.1 TetR/AcrR family transcriptional regulator [Mucilaginibacter flavus]
MARKKEFDEDELLNKAVALFWDKGYHATSAQDLVDGLGINRSSLYNTYTDKRTLFTKSLRQYQAKNTGAVLSMLKNVVNAQEAITQLLYAVIKESEEDELAKGCFMVNTAIELSSHDKEIGSLVAENAKSVEDAFARTIEKGQQDGQFTKAKSAKALAHFVFSTISGLRVSARSGVDKQTLEDIVEVALSALKA